MQSNHTSLKGLEQSARPPTHKKENAISNVRETDIKQLNSFLRGEISACETYQQCIEKIDDPTLKTQLQTLQSSHEKRCQQLETRIRQLGGEPAESSKVWGTFAKLVEGGAKVFGEKAAVAALEEGEDHGLNDYRSDLDDLSPEMKTFVTTQLMPEQVRTHDKLSAIKSSM